MSAGRCTVQVFEHMFDHPAPGAGDLDPRSHRGRITGVDRACEAKGAGMRRYDDPVETRMGLVSGMEGPEQFLWRGRLWKVRAVIAHWVETGPWWQSGGARAVIGSDEPAATGVRRSSPPGADLLAERELWRVEAGRGPGRPTAVDGHGAVDGAVDGGGVFDLAFDWSDGRWALVGCAD
jgi:hypothetical protein